MTLCLSHMVDLGKQRQRKIQRQIIYLTCYFFIWLIWEMQNCTAGDVWMVLQIISTSIRTSRDTFLFSFFFIRTLERYKSIFFGSTQLFWAETEAPHICSSNLITLMGGRVYADRRWRQILQTKPRKSYSLNIYNTSCQWYFASKDQLKNESLKANFSFVMENKARCTVNFAKLFPLLALFFEQF